MTDTPGALTDAAGNPFRPLVLIDITEGAVQGEYYYAGTGEPIVEVRDFDTEDVPAEERIEFADTLDEWASLVAERDDEESAIEFRERAASLREDAEADLREAEHDRRVAAIRDEEAAAARARANARIAAEIGGAP